MRGNSMVLSMTIFFLGFALAVGGVYFYSRASETEYGRMRLEMNASQNALSRAAKKFDDSTESIAGALSAVEKLTERVGVLEKKNPEVTVQLSQPAKPFLVEVIERPRVPAFRSQKEKSKRLTQ